MAQTPKSVSANIQGLTSTTIYTVPALKTAIVRAVIGANANNAANSFSITKTISGQNYPINIDQIPVTVNATGGTSIRGVNLLTAPITMAAGELLKAYSSTASLYNLPNVSTAGTTAADGSTYTLYASAFANSIYMAVGTCTSGAYVATSTDAITWTQQTSALPMAAGFSLLSCNGSVWVATNSGNSQGTVFYSTDNGVTWAPSVVTTTSTNFQCLINNGSTFLISSTGTQKIYSSTNGVTWTDITAYTTAIGSSAAQIYNLGWSGSHWIVENEYGTVASADLTTWFGYVGTNFGRISVSSVYTTTYSAYYSKYYSTKRVAAQPNIFSSTNGLLWENIASSAATPYKICCAGTNTILIGVESGAVTTRLKSTDGSTFTSLVAAGGYTGPVHGLENGYFLSMQNGGTNDACSLSTDPVTSTGTTGGGAVGSFVLSHAAADPISGKWVGIGKNATLIYAIGGTSGTNIGTAYNSTFTVGTYGVPTSVTWSAADSYFYMVTDTGFVFRMSAYNTGWTLQTATAQSFTGLDTSIKSVGTTLYIVSASGGGSYNTVFSSTTASGGSLWNSRNYETSVTYRYMGYIQRTGQYYGDALSTNGTDLVWNNFRGNAFTLTPSVSLYGMRMPNPYAGTAQTVNSNTFMYGGYVSGFGEYTGYFTSTNVITTYGTFVTTFGPGATVIVSVQQPPNKIAYVGGTYYLTSTAVSGLIFNGTTPILMASNYAGVGTTMGGVTVVNPSMGWMLDGTNLVSVPNSGRLNSVCKTTTPSTFLYAATMTASIVEID